MSRSDAAVENFFQLSLLGLVASGFLAVAGSGYLDTATTILTAAGLLLRAALVTGLVRFEISERAVTAATIAYIGFYPLDYQYLSRDFLTATVHLVFFLAVAKILTAKTNRDYLYTAIIAVLELLAAALLSIQLNFFLFLGLFLLCAIAALTSGEIRRAGQTPGGTPRRPRNHIAPRLAGLTAVVTIGVLGMTSALFFLLPRTANAALRHLAARGYYLPGFSSQVTLGQFGEIKSRSTAVMHVRVDDTSGRLNAKWRGAALSDFDGKRWYNAGDAGERLFIGADRFLILTDDTQRRRIGRRLAYRVDLKGIDSPVLFFAGKPEVISVSAPSVIRTEQGNYRVGLASADGLRYEVHAFFENEEPREPDAPAEIPEAVRARYLQLPYLDPRIRPLAVEMTAGAPTTLTKAKAIESRLQRDYGYTLELPRESSADPLAQFLFSRMKGHCEYFASAMTVMLRSIGVPARMVTGFQSGVFNPITEMYVIRASDAHAWVEAYIPGRGWLTFDPTPPDPAALTPSLWSRLALYTDAAETFWQEWIVDYDLGRQVALVVKMEQSSRNFRINWLHWTGESASRWRTAAAEWLSRYYPALLASIALLAAAIVIGPRGWRSLLLRRRVRRAREGRASMADATLLYTRFLEILGARGYTKPPWYTPTEFVRSMRNPEVAEVAGRFVDAYHELRFGGKADAAPRLFVLLEELKRQG